MKLVYIEERNFEQVINKINLEEFFKENKLIVLSNYPHVAIPDNTDICRKIEDNHLNYDIMYIALGNLAYILTCKDKRILNYGPTFNEEDLIEFPIKYYQQKEGKKVESISFYYNHFYPTQHFSFEKLNNRLNKIGISNKQVLEFVDVDFKYDEEKKISDKKQRKMIAIPIYFLLFELENKTKETLKEYLETGNFLTLLTFTGNHYGYPFSVDIGDVLDTKPYADDYRKLISFFNTLNIEDDQVTNFKTSYTGINFRGGCYNFGYSYYNMNEFFEIWLKYLENKGYNINEEYLLGYKPKDFELAKNQYLMPDINTQDKFNQTVKEKVLK